MAFNDISPAAPVHVLIIPKIKNNLNMIENATENDVNILGHMLFKSTEIAKLLNLTNGYRLIINNGEDGGEITRPNSGPLSHSFVRRQEVSMF